MYEPAIIRASTELARLIADRCPADFEGQTLEVTSARIMGLFEGVLEQVRELADEQFPDDYVDDDEDGEKVPLDVLRRVLTVAGPPELWTDPVFQRLWDQHLTDLEEQGREVDLMVDPRTLLNAYHLVRDWGGSGMEPTMRPRDGEEG